MPVVGDIGSRLRHWALRERPSQVRQALGVEVGLVPGKHRDHARGALGQRGQSGAQARDRPAEGRVLPHQARRGGESVRSQFRGANDDDLGSAARGQDAIEHRRPGEGGQNLLPAHALRAAPRKDDRREV